MSQLVKATVYFEAPGSVIPPAADAVMAKLVELEKLGVMVFEWECTLLDSKTKLGKTQKMALKELKRREAEAKGAA